MKRTASRFCLLILLMTTAAVSFAQNSPGEPPAALTLEQAIGIAVAENAKISAARSRFRASEERTVQARSGFFPQVNISETFQHTTNPMWAFGTKLNQESIQASDFDPARLNDPDAIDNFAGRLSVSWSLFDSGQTWIGWRQAKLGQTAASCALDSVRQQVIAHTVGAYAGLLLAREELVVVQKTLETARRHLQMVRSRFESGFVVKSDLLRAQVHIADLEQQLLQAESRWAVARSVLNAAMGVPESSVYRPASPLETAGEIEGSVEEWIERALEHRPDFKRLQHGEIIAREEVKKTKAAHLPSFSLVGNYEMNSEDFSEQAENYTLGAVVSLNLFSGQRLTAKTREAQAFLAEVTAMQRETEQGIRVQTRQAFFEARSAGKRILVARAAVAQAEEALRIIRNRYNSGLLNIVELLDAELALKKARSDHLKSMHDYKVAAARLHLAAGVLDESFR